MTVNPIYIVSKTPLFGDIHQMQKLLDGAVTIRGESQIQKATINPDEAGACHITNTFGCVHPDAEEYIGINDRKQDGSAIITGYK